MIESDIAVGAGLRITCAKDELVQGLTLVGRAVSSRTAIQILSGILLEAQGDELRLAATDMELSLRATVPARVEGDGAVVLPGRTLVDIEGPQVAHIDARSRRRHHEGLDLVL